MSLDKFVTHGLHGTLGTSSGRSLRSDSSHQPDRNAANGTSFVLGGGRAPNRNYNAPQPYRASGPTDALDSIRSYEAERTRELRDESSRVGWSGGARRHYREALEARERYYHRFIAFAFLAIMLIVVVFFVFGWPQSAQERVREMRDRSKGFSKGVVHLRSSYANLHGDE